LKVIIAGSRTIIDLMAVVRAVNESGYRPTKVVSGKAPKGVDSLGEFVAGFLDVPVIPFPAKWDLYGRKVAGFIRNEEMADYADSLVAVWDGNSRGTKHMIECMMKRGKPYHVRDLSKKQEEFQWLST
jgi:hypothetical protein